MRIFVLTTGRAASKTFAMACSHIHGMSAMHESQSSLLEGRLKYPDQHVEVDNRLAWFLGSLDRLYDDTDTYYVFLRRDRAKVAESYRRRWFVQQSLVRGFFQSILMRKGEASDEEQALACRLCMETLEDNIAFFLKGRRNCSIVTVENLKEDFARFIEAAGVECDMEKALAALDVKTNMNKEATGSRRSFKRAVGQIANVVKRLPGTSRRP